MGKFHQKIFYASSKDPFYESKQRQCHGSIKTEVTTHQK